MKLNLIQNVEELITFLSKILKSSDFRIDRINFDSQDDWGLKDGAFSHKSGGFFHVVGVNTSIENEEDLFFFQPQSALTGILIHKTQDEIYVLVQARIEPGNTGVIQLGPTVQSTPSNYQRIHGGKHTSYLDYFYSYNSQTIGFNSSNHLDLGKRYYHKTKWLNYALVDELIETEDSFAWISVRTLIEASSMNYILNTDLRSLLAIYDWDSLIGTSNKKNTQNSKILNYNNQKKSTINCTDRFVPLEKSENIFVSNNTIYCKRNSKSEIGLYKISTKHREVETWTQPLWSASGIGLVLLLCRNYHSEDDTEFLLTVESEKGILGKCSISASFLRYPNEDVQDNLIHIGSTLKEFYQSDEGGRFINHEYLFRVAEVNVDIKIQKNQFWVNYKELKNILSNSNLSNIQLRNICSVLIDSLNPHLKTHKL